METDLHIDTLEHDGGLLADVAGRAGLGAPVPSCPPWRVRDLLTHLGFVHRWATGYLAQAHPQMAGEPDETEVLRTGPPDPALLGWFRDGHAALVAALRTADPALECWTFLPAPSPLAFWARRQAHETAVHRADAQIAAGVRASFAADFAADGIDELLLGFAGRRAPAERGERDGLLHVRASDTGDEWCVVLGSEIGACRGDRWPGARRQRCVVAGPAAGLYLLLWNRLDAVSAGVSVTGEAGLLTSWRSRMRVRWE